jgi:predicted transcriptional regulator
MRALCVASIFIGSMASAATLEVGDSFPPLANMQDQHEVAYAVPEDTQYIAVAFTMSDGKAANRYFEAQGAEFLPSKDAVFIANIYGMPGIGRFFAMPKMRKYPHRIMLADEEGLLDAFPQEEDAVTIFELDDRGQIKAISFWNPKSEVAPF